MIELTIAIFKYAGIVLTGVFGILGLLVKFKDDNGHVTKAGRNALVLIITSAIVSLGAQSFELIKARGDRQSAAEAKAQDTLEAVQRTEKLIVEINRGLHPIAGLSLSDWISVPSDHVQLKNYVERFNRNVGLTVQQLERDKPVIGIVGTTKDSSRRIDQFAFDGTSTLSPNRSTEKLAHTVFGYSTVELQFYRKPITVKDFPPVSEDSKYKPDLKLSASAGLNSSGLDGQLSVEYHVKDEAFRLSSHMVPSDPKFWESDGEIVGLQDLLGTQLFVRLPSVMLSGDVVIDQYVPEIRRRFKLETLVISFYGGFELWLRHNDLEAHADKDGLPFYVYVFPTTMAGLQRLKP